MNTTNFSDRMRAMHTEAHEALKAFMAKREFYWLLDSKIDIYDSNFNDVEIEHLPEFESVIDRCYLVALKKDERGNILFDGVGLTDRELIEDCTSIQLSCEDICSIADMIPQWEEQSSDNGSNTFFANGFENWHETHFEVIAHIQATVDNEGSIANHAQESGGRGALYELAKDLTNEFEKIHLNKFWDGEFFDAVDEFLNEKENSHAR